ncbi:Peptidase M76, ATP23, partial [Dillenia turbinata]
MEHLAKFGCAIGYNFIKAIHCDQRLCPRRRGNLFLHTSLCSFVLYFESVKISYLVNPISLNHMNLQDDVNQVIIHKLIHAYDERRAANLNRSNCSHHACNEVRIPCDKPFLNMIHAGHLSGDCHYKREWLHGTPSIYMGRRYYADGGGLHVQHHQAGGRSVHGQATVPGWLSKITLPFVEDSLCEEKSYEICNGLAASGVAAKDAVEAVWDTCYNDTNPFDRIALARPQQAGGRSVHRQAVVPG